MNAINDLSNIIDIEILQKIQDDFSAVFNIPAVIFDAKGKPITKASNFTEFCKYVRSFKAGEQICMQSDEKVFKASEGIKKPHITQTCKITKIISATAPIIINGKHLANFGIGQILDGEADKDNIRRFADQTGADADELFKKTKSLAHADKDKLSQIINFLDLTVNQICQLAFKNLEKQILIEKLEEREKQLSAAKKDIEISEKFKKLVLNSTREMFALYDTDMKILWMNKSLSDFLADSGKHKSDDFCYNRIFGRNTICENCIMKTVKQTGKTAEDKIQAPKGKLWLVRGYPIFDKGGKLTNFVEFIQDVTESEAIQRQLVFQTGLLSGINDFITATDLEGNITYANATLR